MTEESKTEIDLFAKPSAKTYFVIERLADHLFHVFVATPVILERANLRALPYVDRVDESYKSPRELYVYINPCWDRDEAQAHFTQHLTDTIASILDIQAKGTEVS